MRRRKLLVVLAGLAVVGAAGAFVLWPWPSSRITLENCNRIREGMSRAEVEAILGPPGDHSSGPVDFAGRTALAMGSGGRARPALVFTPIRRDAFEDNNPDMSSHQAEVRFKCDWMVQRIDQSLSENILWRAKRQWHRWFP